MEDKESESLQSSVKLNDGSSSEKTYGSVDTGYQDDDIGINITVSGNEEPCCSRLCDKIYPAGFKKEMRSMLALTWMICLTQIGQMIIGPISLIFCGHLGDPIQLDGAALAISMINATCIAVGQGLGTACDTFFSQTFGSRNKKQVGVYVQKSILIFLLALLGCFAVHINLTQILLVLGQHPDVAVLAGRYVILFMPGALSFFLYIVLSKYVQNQNIVIPNVIIGLVANAVNAALHWVFLYELEMGTDGSAIAQATAYFVMFLLTLIYIVASRVYEDTWDGWSMEALQDWGKFVRLCIPGMLMLCMEWWGFEIGVFLTGVLGTTELGAQSVLLQLDSIWFQIPLGIQISCAIRVGQYLGAGSADGAKTASRLAITMIIISSIGAAVLFLSLQYKLPYLFTNIDSIAQLTGDLFPIVALYVFFDGVATACKGVLYGTGRQIYGAILLFVSYYILALPMGIPLMFLTSLRSAGYWWALAANLVIQAIALFAVVMRTDWDKQVQGAQERAGMLGEETKLGKELDDDPPSETTSLLESYESTSTTQSGTTMLKKRSRRRSRLLSTTLSVSEIQAVLKEEPMMSTGQLICRRLLALSIMLAIFAAGLCFRIFVPLHDYLTNSNATLVNSTAVSIDNVTMSYT